VFLWFISTAVLTIYFVFRDPAFDYRALLVGVLLPDLVDSLFGGARVFHSLAGAVGLMALAMLASAGRRPVRKKLLAVPIGVLLHIVFDGAFANTDVFWWPFSGGFGDAALPVVERGWWNVALELVGAALLVWCVRLFGLSDPQRRRHFVRTGELTAADSRA
jgi:hypothetical protein